MILILDSSRNKKFSQHIIFPELVLPSVQHCKVFVLETIAELNGDCPEVQDC